MVNLDAVILEIKKYKKTGIDITACNSITSKRILRESFVVRAKINIFHFIFQQLPPNKQKKIILEQSTRGWVPN